MKCERKIVKLADILADKGYIRGPFGSALKRAELLSEGIPVYEQQHAINNTREFRFYINGEKFQSMKRFQVQENDLIISCSGTIGCVSIIGADDPKGIISQALLILRSNTDIVLPQYLKYYFISKEGYNSIVSRSSGSVQVNIAKREIIEQIRINLPSIRTQEKIVSILKSIDGKIENNNKINDNLQQQLTAIFREWFIDAYKSTEWPLVTLDSLTSLVSRGITPKYTDNSTQIVLNQKCIRDHYIDVSLGRQHKPKIINEKWLQYGDLLINSTGEGTLGRTAQVWFTPENLTVDSHVTIVRAKNQLLLFYIGLWGITHEREIEALHTGSTGQTELPRDRVKAMELNLPDNDTLTRFNSVITPLVSTIIVNQRENTRLASIRDALLPKLMSGELDISGVQL